MQLKNTLKTNKNLAKLLSGTRTVQLFTSTKDKNTEDRYEFTIDDPDFSRKELCHHYNKKGDILTLRNKSRSTELKSDYAGF